MEVSSPEHTREKGWSVASPDQETFISRPGIPSPWVNGSLPKFLQAVSHSASHVFPNIIADPGGGGGSGGGAGTLLSMMG